ncbi:MAG: M20/M25/M40 family metallo-hydrolase [Deltaproteobacteria bacterium]|nr:M20/M25/M40 family metallo-hydrolase [Deltaproteobacteria bacterium]
MRSRLVVAAAVSGLGAGLLSACQPPYKPSQPVAWVDDTSSFSAPAPPSAGPIADRYRDTAAKIIAFARADRGAWAKLAQLADQIGHRLSGSPELDRAIAWAVQAMKSDGHDVRTEPVMVPHWVRGVEEGAVVAPVVRTLKLIGLGGTVPTPKGGITAPVVVVRSWDELEASADRVKGAIVLYDVAMPAWTEDKGSGYGDVAPFRTRGPSRAAKLGAAAVLMRSVTARSLRSPHTGALSYDPALPKIPAAAVTVEDAEQIARLAAAGPVTVRLRLESQQLPDAPSANVLGELRGRELPDEVVVIGAHLDSWDVGQGAHDDGAGCVTMMQALTVLRRLGLQPRRTIRVVLFTNEENGLRGGRAYAETHRDELGKTVLAVEADAGGFPPRGFSLEAKPEVAPRALARLQQIVSLYRPGLGPLHARAGHGGADISPMVPAGVPTVGLEVDGRLYFDYHHSEADTLDKVDPVHLADDVAAVAVLAFVAADLPERLDAP